MKLNETLYAIVKPDGEIAVDARDGDLCFGSRERLLNDISHDLVHRTGYAMSALRVIPVRIVPVEEKE